MQNSPRMIILVLVMLTHITIAMGAGGVPVPRVPTPRVALSACTIRPTACRPTPRGNLSTCPERPAPLDDNFAFIERRTPLVDVFARTGRAVARLRIDVPTCTERPVARVDASAFTWGSGGARSRCRGCGAARASERDEPSPIGSCV